MKSGYGNTSGEANIAIGNASLYSNVSGKENIGIGFQTLFHCVGDMNTAVGFKALHYNQVSRNTAFGGEALFQNTTGIQNTAMGYQSSFSGNTGNRNSAMGYMALKNNYTNDNTAMGNEALRDNNNGSQNSAFGSRALSSNVSGEFNSAMGYLSLGANTSGTRNTAMGRQSLRFNTVGSRNTALGYGSLLNNSDGIRNTAVGYNALLSNTTGDYNTAIGYEADVQSINLFNATAIGYQAKVLTDNTIQLGNSSLATVKVGANSTAKLVTPRLQVSDGNPVAGMVLTATGPSGDAVWQNLGTGNAWFLNGNTGTNGTTNFIGTTDAVPLNFRVNGFKSGRIDYDFQKGSTFLGFRAGEATTIGGGNTALGYNALAVNTIGNNNTVVGFTAMDFNLDGYRNTAVGVSALGTNLNGFQNTAVGFRALDINSSGTNNAALGRDALAANVSGSCNTAVGAGANVDIGGRNYATAIGCNAIVNTSNKVRIGDATIAVIEGQVAYTYPSDGRFKTNINQNDVVGLAFIQKLRPVVYNFDTRRFTQFLTKNMPDSLAAHYLADDFGPSTAIRQSGFIAQEVEQAAKEVGCDFNGVHVPADENDNYSLAYAQFVVPLVKGMQEQQAMIEAQQAQISELQALVRTLTQTCCPGSGGVPAQGGTKADAPANGSASEPAAPAHPAEVFPNPSEGRFTMRIAPLEQGHYEVFDQHGQQVLRQALTPGQTEYTIDLSGKASGSYLLRLHSHCGVVATKQLVVQ